MFDIGFWEIVVIGVVALLVVGPDKFPGMVKNVGYWVGRFRHVASAVKNELQTEINKAEQLQKLLEEQEKIVKRHDLLEQEESPTVSIKGRAPSTDQTHEKKPADSPSADKRTDSSERKNS